MMSSISVLVLAGMNSHSKDQKEKINRELPEKITVTNIFGQIYRICRETIVWGVRIKRILFFQNRRSFNLPNSYRQTNVKSTDKSKNKDKVVVTSTPKPSLTLKPSPTNNANKQEAKSQIIKETTHKNTETHSDSFSSTVYIPLIVNYTEANANPSSVTKSGIHTFQEEEYIKDDHETAFSKPKETPPIEPTKQLNNEPTHIGIPDTTVTATPNYDQSPTQSPSSAPTPTPTPAPTSTPTPIPTPTPTPTPEPTIIIVKDAPVMKYGDVNARLTKSFEKLLDYEKNIDEIINNFKENYESIISTHESEIEIILKVIGDTKKDHNYLDYIPFHSSSTPDKHFDYLLDVSIPKNEKGLWISEDINSYFEFHVMKHSYINKISFGYVPDERCIVDQFTFSVQYKGNAEIFSEDFRLKVRSDKSQNYSLPFTTKFDTLRLYTISNHGNDTYVCIPEFRAFQLGHFE